MKICAICKLTPVEKAHLLSKPMSRMLIILQGLNDWESFCHSEGRLHPRKGHVWLCRDHHRESDKLQRRIEPYLLNLMTDEQFETYEMFRQRKAEKGK